MSWQYALPPLIILVASLYSVDVKQVDILDVHWE